MAPTASFKPISSVRVSFLLPIRHTSAFYHLPDSRHAVSVRPSRHPTPLLPLLKQLCELGFFGKNPRSGYFLVFRNHLYLHMLMHIAQSSLTNSFSFPSSFDTKTLTLSVKARGLIALVHLCPVDASPQPQCSKLTYFYENIVFLCKRMGLTCWPKEFFLPKERIEAFCNLEGTFNFHT